MKKALKIWSRLSASSPSAVDDNFARCVTMSVPIRAK